MQAYAGWSRQGRRRRGRRALQRDGRGPARARASPASRRRSSACAATGALLRACGGASPPSSPTGRSPIVSTGFDHLAVALSVGVQHMVRSDLGVGRRDVHARPRDAASARSCSSRPAGASARPSSRARSIPTSSGCTSRRCARGSGAILRRSVGSKGASWSTPGPDGLPQNVPSAAPPSARRFVPVDDEVLELARWAVAIEEHYSRRAARRRRWTSSGRRTAPTGELFMVQARPETVHRARTSDAVDSTGSRPGERRW